MGSAIFPPRCVARLTLAGLRTKRLKEQQELPSKWPCLLKAVAVQSLHFTFLVGYLT